MASKWCGLWTSEQPTCMWYAVGPAASAAGGVVTWRLKNDPSGSVLHTLKLLDAAGWSTMEHSVAVVNSWQDQTTGQRLCELSHQQVSYVSNGLSVIVTYCHCVCPSCHVPAPTSAVVLTSCLAAEVLSCDRHDSCLRAVNLPTAITHTYMPHWKPHIHKYGS